MKTWILLLAAALLAAPAIALAKDGGAPGPHDDGQADDRDPGNATGDGKGTDEREAHDADEAHEHGPRFHDHGDKLVLRNDNVTIWFHLGDRSKPDLMVFRTGADGNRTGFKVQLDELFEARPAGNATDDGGDDGDGASWHRAAAHRVSLEPAREWYTSVGNATDEVTVTMAHLFNQGNVTLVFHIPANGSAVKFDVQVQDWKWADANDTLALRLKVLERGADDKGGNATFAGGFVTWAKSAEVRYPNGTAATIPVLGEVRNHDEGARILLRFGSSGGYSKLTYDPTLGVQGGASQSVPGLEPLMALGAVGAAALVAARRR